MQIQQIDIKDLILPKNNPRSISRDAMQKLCDSLKKDPEFFQSRPVLAHKTDIGIHVYAGNQRVRAAKSLKWKKVPCIIEENLSHELIQERMIKDNMHQGEWDYDILANEFNIEMLLDVGFTTDQLHIDLDLEDPSHGDEDQPEKECCDKCGQKIKKK